jgi:hypothetical protein
MPPEPVVKLASNTTGVPDPQRVHSSVAQDAENTEATNWGGLGAINLAITTCVVHAARRDQSDGCRPS